jgi:hypothetical protein
VRDPLSLAADTYASDGRSSLSRPAVVCLAAVAVQTLPGGEMGEPAGRVRQADRPVSLDPRFEVLELI